MPLPALPTLGPDTDENVQALWLYLSHLKDSLDDFTPSQMAAALDLGALGTGPGSPLNGVTVPVSPPVPATPVMNPPVGFYRQIVTSWDIDINPFITGWEVQRADDLLFTVNVVTRTSARALMFVDNDLPDSTQRFYRIRALTEDPANFSAFCAPQGATTLANDTGVLAALQDAAVLIQRAHIHNLVVDTAMIADASILTAKIADAQITTAKIVNLAVTTAKVDDLAVTTAKIANLAVTNAKINDLAADKITAGTISVLVSLTNNTIKLDGTTNLITITDTQGSPVIRVSLGKLGAGASDYGLLCRDASGNVMFDSRDQGATNFGIKDLEIISAKLNDLAVLTGKIANNAVTANAAAGSSAPGYTNSTTTYSDIVSVTLTTTGSPVFVTCGGTIGLENTSASSLLRAVAWRLTRDDAPLREAGTSRFVVASETGVAPIPLLYVDPAPSAGSHTYKIQGKCVTSSTTMTAAAIDLVALEIKK